MAEFCYECFKKMFDSKKKKRQLYMSDYRDICEGCGKMKRVVIAEKATCWLTDKVIDLILTAYAKKESGKYGTDEEIFEDLRKHKDEIEKR